MFRSSVSIEQLRDGTNFIVADLIEGRCEGFFQDLVSKAIAVEMLNQFIRQFDRDLHNALA